MSINSITKKQNVYNAQEKINAFLSMYADPVELDQRVLIKQLEAYRHYLSWSEDFFNIGSYFYYDTCMHDIENYILNLPIFKNRGNCVTWQQRFGISLEDWNRCQWVSSDLGALPTGTIARLHEPQKMLEDNKVLEYYQQFALPDWPPAYTHADVDGLPADVKKQFHQMLQQKIMPIHELRGQLAPKARNFVEHHQDACDRAATALDRMRELDIITSRPPIKKQTLGDKKRTLRNWDQCMETYNIWAQQHSDIAGCITSDQIDQQIQEENDFWRQYHLESSQVNAAPAILKS